MTDAHTGTSLDTAMCQAFRDISAKKDGLWSKVLILLDNVTSFGNDEMSFNSSLFSASGGDVDLFLANYGYANQDEEKLSRRDSEVASLQEASSWLEAHSSASVTVILLSNIGPCDGCKQRLANFRGQLVQYYQTPPVVRVYYSQSGGSANKAVRGNAIKTVYGYAGAGAETLSDGTRVWRYDVT
jgi:hypothetical protein